MIKSAVREAADFLVDFIRKVRYTVTVQSYADLFSADACIQMEYYVTIQNPIRKTVANAT